MINLKCAASENTNTLRSPQRVIGNSEGEGEEGVWNSQFFFKKKVRTSMSSRISKEQVSKKTLCQESQNIVRINNKKWQFKSLSFLGEGVLYDSLDVSVIRNLPKTNKKRKKERKKTLLWPRQTNEPEISIHYKHFPLTIFKNPRPPPHLPVYYYNYPLQRLKMSKISLQRPINGQWCMYNVTLNT